ncbi:hypothetical protein KBY58_10240 [Cyanobium sp. HWJ4-Hawea]|uniref:hypothetical protein n=1 Tax=Cyanobium sp. HWJ4-Hawea TaxID=2823713 RepID=UPI0020CF7766|nr:hypothetical protein [Cyanobium sp. HWJ4-Hawea]MCP9809812.1 hypothetical protein [Cyanobium sp. HWJ4-Hawea]
MAEVITPIIATVHVGSQYPDQWVGKLARSVAKHVKQPHTFTIYTDKVAANNFECTGFSHQIIKLVDIEANQLLGYFAKLRLFDQRLTGVQPFLYLDLTLVVRNSLDPLIEEGQSGQASLIGVADWNYPILNSSVLWIKPSPATQEVWTAWCEERYDKSHFPGDQNFIFKVFQDKNNEELQYWPSEWISSYKVLLKTANKNRQLAATKLNQSLILKFHGKPKMDSVLAALPPLSIVLRYPLNPWLWRYLRAELKSDWGN